MGRTVMEAGTMNFWAREIAQLAVSARALPPTWQHGDAWPILYGDVTLGAILPGLGVHIDVPLRTLGITRPLPYVVERSLWDRCLDTLSDPRMAAGLAAACVGAAVLGDVPISAPLVAGTLTTFNSVVAAIGAGRSDIVLCNYLPFSTSFNSVAGQWAFPYDLFRPSPFVLSTGLSATAPSRTSAGALNGYAQAPGSGQTQILQAVHELNRTSTNIVQPAAHLFVDLLYECGPVVMTTATLQTLGSAAITRYTDGVGVFMVALGLNSGLNITATATVTYTNSAGTGSRTTTFAHSGNSGHAPYITKPPFNVWPFLEMQSGDVGVRSVESVQWSNATGTSETHMLLVKPLAMAYAKKNSEFRTNDYMAALRPIALADGACLALFGRLNNPASQFREFDSTFALRFTSV